MQNEYEFHRRNAGRITVQSIFHGLLKGMEWKSFPVNLCTVTNKTDSEKKKKVYKMNRRSQGK